MADMAERETSDFMDVESFSQLPFIRPAPVKEKGIKLFGIEFGVEDAAAPNASDEPEQTTNMETNMSEEVNKDSNIESGESGRRFECHYCCRNFPTSQALGGHQNAHKRERQNAKRAHIQSAMVHSSLADAHLYGFMNYKLGSAVINSSPIPTYYPTWNANTNGTSRFYGSHGSLSHQQPINGSPLAVWRIPSSIQTNPGLGYQRSSVHPLPLFAADDTDMMKSSQANGSNSDPPSQGRYAYDVKASMPDHVSLDLHL
ncbi:hypothetical protein SAY87_007578 [Trapa incisa]|uniref:C2H2-type domain-containing protein n=1 Tax=Trapa incisa TaxID=236973 RepID=A0AAN7KKQ6_9MYRT|nr:hypothetical protein SAY87_007578 [Trapa incisa]